jgi:hypothetical protein
MKYIGVFLTLIIIVNGCIPMKQNPKYLFSSGVYRIRGKSLKNKAYLDVKEDKIRVYSRDKAGKYDTIHYSAISLSDTIASDKKHYNFIKSSLDFDLISIPLKFRPAVAGFPAQLNATVNGGLYIGHRADIYRLSRRRDELGIARSAVQHYGISFGAFTGIGSAMMNPSVTLNRIATEYDAVVMPFGLTMLIGYNNLTFGIAGGLDHMFSNQRKYWIYKGKPWIGLTVGLNLN